MHLIHHLCMDWSKGIIDTKTFHNISRTGLNTSVLVSADSTGRFYIEIVSMDTIPSSSLTELQKYWKHRVIYSHFSHTNTALEILYLSYLFLFRVLLKTLYFNEAVLRWTTVNTPLSFTIHQQILCTSYNFLPLNCIRICIISAI